MHQHFQKCGCQLCPCISKKNKNKHHLFGRNDDTLGVHNSQCPIRKIYIHAEKSFQLLFDGAEKDVVTHFIDNVQSNLLNVHSVSHTPNNVKGVRTRVHKWYSGTLKNRIV